MKFVYRRPQWFDPIILEVDEVKFSKHPEQPKWTLCEYTETDSKQSDVITVEPNEDVRIVP